MSSIAEPAMGRHRRRSAFSFGAALLLHGAALGLAGLVALASPLPTVPVSLELEVPPTPAPVMEAVQAAAPRQEKAASAPSAAPAAVSASKPVASSAAAGSGFVIPTVKPQAGAAAPATTGGNSFRTAGGTTGAGTGMPAQPSPLPAALVAAGQGGSGATAGSGSTQRSGQGVDASGTGAGGGPIDVGKPGTALAGGGKSGQGTSGSATAGGGGGTATGLSDDKYRLSWEEPDAAADRKLLKKGDPEIPASVGAQGLGLTTVVSFSLRSDGLVWLVKVETASLNPDMDRALVKAVERWRFSPAQGAAPITGYVTFIIQAR